MKVLKIISFILIIVPSYVYSQKDSIISDIKTDTTFIVKISPDLSQIFIHYSDFTVNYKEDHPFYGKVYYSVEIRNSRIGKPFQVIKGFTWLPVVPLSYDNENENVEESMAEDINFDGYKDLRFNCCHGEGRYAVNQAYVYYLYDHKKNKFVFNEDVSALSNPTPFIKEKIVRSYIRNGFAGTSGNVNEYEWNKNKLELLRVYYYDVIEDSCRSDTECKFNCFIEYYKNNQVIKTETKIMNITDIPVYHRYYW